MKVKPYRKTCDRCLKKRLCKRYNVMRHFPNYVYVAFDLCEECEKEFEEVVIKFMRGYLTED